MLSLATQQWKEVSEEEKREFAKMAADQFLTMPIKPKKIKSLRKPSAYNNFAKIKMVELATIPAKSRMAEIGKQWFPRKVSNFHVSSSHHLKLSGNAIKAKS